MTSSKKKIKNNNSYINSSVLTPFQKGTHTDNFHLIRKILFRGWYFRNAKIALDKIRTDKRSFLIKKICLEEAFNIFFLEFQISEMQIFKNK